MTTIQVEQCK